MELSELLCWIGVTDLEVKSSDEILTVLDEVLRAYPESRSVSDLEYDFLAELEEAAELEEPDIVLLRSFLPKYAALMPKPESPLESSERELLELAESLSPEQVTTARLSSFLELLQAIEESGVEESMAALESLESRLKSSWESYIAGRFQEDEVSAQSVAGHRFLEAGFQCWFEAVEAAQREEIEKAQEAAWEGNRLLSAVSLWSDSLPRDGSVSMGQG